MSTQVQLRNGRWLEATALPGDLFEAILASGKSKIYPMSELRAVLTDGQEEVIPNKKEEKMTNYINHYLHRLAFTDDDGEQFAAIVRALTSNVPDATKADYLASVESKTVVNNVLALNSGNWMFHLLKARLEQCHVNFKTWVIKLRTQDDVYGLDNMSAAKRQELIDGSTFCYANADYAFFFKVEGVPEFGLHLMGLNITHAKKSAKRLQELFRQVEAFLHLEGEDQKSLTWDFNPRLDLAGDEVKRYDGKTYIRQSFALRMAENISDLIRRASVIRAIRSRKLVHITIRILTPQGLLKGDAVIVPDNQISADISTVSENVKGELFTNDFTFACMWEHAMVHNAVWDDQSAINFGYALSEQAQISDIIRLVENLRNAIQTGELPEWLLLGEDGHGDDGLPSVEKLSDTINKSWVRFQAFGLDIKAAQNLLYMALNGVILRMIRAGMTKEGFYRKMWIPMTNACLLTINTWESATRVGGFNFHGRNKNIAFYDPRCGFVISSQRFIETYHLHGGWDLDDSVKVILVKVFCSDAEILTQHVHKTVPGEIEYPTSADDAKLMVLLVRSPNGPGEWSIEECDITSLPIPQDFRHDDITVIDIAKMPLPQDVMLAQVGPIAGFTSNMKYTGLEMTRAEGELMVNAQMSNPGVGEYCNGMMWWALIKPGSFPPIMNAKMEEVVDTSQQEHDAVKFAAIKAETDLIIKQALATNLPVDAAFASTRMSFTNMMKVRLVKGRFYRVQHEYKKAIETMRTELRDHTLQMRAADPTVQAVKHMRFGDELFQWAEHFYVSNSQAMTSTDRAYEVSPKDHPFHKMEMARLHKEAMEEIVASMVKELDDFGDETNNHVLALWKYINHSTRRFPMGVSDRIVFHPNKTGERSVMDVLIEALLAVNLAVKPSK